ncbi:MAG: hypothetical protein E6Q95_03235 [Chitinophagaceae bacterium]|nr:MAG: hypothetical protein E6Q95_03235 [Chitinophagaceae bacterium]
MLITHKSFSQTYEVKGTVYDSTGTKPVPYVSVITTNGNGAITDLYGNYSIQLRGTDSIWFSYLNKPTHKYAYKDIKAPYSFNISIKMFIENLPEVKISPRNYRQDSIENREVYAKIFDFQKPNIHISATQGGVGIDLTELINIFRFNRTKRMVSFQNRLIKQEQDKYIEHRFYKGLVRRLTGIDDDSLLLDFMELYKPSYLFITQASDYDLFNYIVKSYARFKKHLLPSEMWRNGLGLSN